MSAQASITFCIRMQRESDTNETQNLQKQIKQFSFVCLIYIHDRGGGDITRQLSCFTQLPTPL